MYSAELQRLLVSRSNLRIVAAFVSKVLDPATQRDWNGKESKVEFTNGRYVMRQRTLGKIPMGKNPHVSIKGKELCEYAPHSGVSNFMRSAPTLTANMKGKAGSEDG